MKSWLLIILQLGAVFFIGCKEEKNDTLSITTLEVSAITSTTAQSGGTIQFQGDNVILSQGVCWSMDPLPTVENDTTSDVLENEFTSLITGLKASTKYYVRAYAITNSGTIYGNEVSFTTVAFSNWQNFTVENSSLPGNSISEIAVDNEGIAWLASANYLVRFDRDSFTSFKFSETEGTGKIFIDHLNNKWFRTYSWVYKFNGSSFEKYEPVLGLYLQRDKRLCMVRRGRVETLDIDTGESEFCETPGDGNYLSMIEDLEDRKFGFRQTSVDGYFLDATSDFCAKGQPIANESGVFSCEFVLSPDSLIYYTSAYGFNIMKTDLTIKYIGPANSQLPSAWTLDIAISDNGSRVWVGCNKVYEDHFDTSLPRAGGLAEYNPADGKITVYNTSNSDILSDHVSAVAIANNKILIGTDSGLSVYTPK